jgi:hypothetical protein
MKPAKEIYPGGFTSLKAYCASLTADESRSFMKARRDSKKAVRDARTETENDNVEVLDGQSDSDAKDIPSQAESLGGEVGNGEEVDCGLDFDELFASSNEGSVREGEQTGAATTSDSRPDVGSPADKGTASGPAIAIGNARPQTPGTFHI